MRNKERKKTEIRKFLRKGPAGPTAISRATEIPKTTVHHYLDEMDTAGEVKNVGGWYQLILPEVEIRLQDLWRDCTSIAYAPFSPMIAGAHIVLRGYPSLIFPINAYVAVGVREIPKSKGGRVTMVDYPMVDYGVRSSVSLSEIEKMLHKLTDLACQETGRSRDHMPNYHVRIFSTFDIASGLGGSAALAAATALCFFSATKSISGSYLAKENSEEFKKIFSLAYKMEEYIHGKGIVKNGPYSSGASVLGAFRGNPKGVVYRYEVKNENKLANGEVPDYQSSEISVGLPLTNFLIVLGRPKATRDCLMHMNDLLDNLKDFKKLIDTYFLLWKDVVNDLQYALRTGKQQTTELLKFQNSLYVGLGLGTEEFSRLSERTSMIHGVGGSIIGGGKGGASLIYCSKPEQTKLIRSALWNEPVLSILPSEVFDHCTGAKILR